MHPKHMVFWLQWPKSFTSICCISRQAGICIQKGILICNPIKPALEPQKSAGHNYMQASIDFVAKGLRLLLFQVAAVVLHEIEQIRKPQPQKHGS